MGKQTQSSFKCHMYQIDNKCFPALDIFSYSAASTAALLLVVFLVKCQVPCSKLIIQLWRTPIRKLKSPTRNIVLYFDFWGLSLLKCRPTIFLLRSLWISSSLCLSKHLTRHTHTHTHISPWVLLEWLFFQPLWFLLQQVDMNLRAVDEWGSAGGAQRGDVTVSDRICFWLSRFVSQKFRFSTYQCSLSWTPGPVSASGYTVEQTGHVKVWLCPKYAYSLRQCTTSRLRRFVVVCKSWVNIGLHYIVRSMYPTMHH